MAKNPFLWHQPTRVEVEVVRTAMKLLCGTCGQLPATRRLSVRVGSGRGATTAVYCVDCGCAWIRERRAEADRAIKVLTTGTGYIRLP
jgi:RNase P subunit RPR2